MALSVLEAVDGADDPVQRIYYDLLMTALPGAARKELQTMALSGNYEYQSDFAKKYLAQGLEQGRAEGRNEGLADAVILLCERRGQALGSELMNLIRTSSTETLQDWLLQLADGADINEVVGR